MLVGGLIALASLAATPGAAQAPAPCAPGVAPAATIRGFDVEDGGGVLTATHTIALEAHDRDGYVPNVTFSLPPAAQARGTEGNPAFSIDTPGRAHVSATWSYDVESDGSAGTCTASAERTFQLQAPEALTFRGVPPGVYTDDGFQLLVRAGKNADLRPVEFRLRGVRRARLPGRAARLQRIALSMRRGDPGLPLTDVRRPRAAGWKFHVGYVDQHEVGIGAQVIDSHRGRRGRASGFGFSIEFVQARHRVGRIRAVGSCGYLGCRWRALP